MPKTRSSASQGVKRQHSDADQDDQDGADVCWVCLDAEGQPDDGPLFQPCICPRKVHPLCLARWQLRSAGRDEEKRCRFCSHGLPDWRASMQTRAAQDVRRCGVKAPATMTVAFNGQTNEVEVEAGPHGFARFVDSVRALFGISADLSMDLNFDCVEPTSGHPLQLNGSGAFDAAVHCAAMAAASRARKRLRRSALARRLLPTFLTRSASCAPVMEQAATMEAAATAPAEVHAASFPRRCSSGLDLLMPAPSAPAAAAVPGAESALSPLDNHLATEPAGAHIRLWGLPNMQSPESRSHGASGVSTLRCVVPKTVTQVSPVRGIDASADGACDAAPSPLLVGPVARWGISPDFQLCRQWTTASAAC